MRARQQAIPLLLSVGSDKGVPLQPLADNSVDGGVREADIQALVQSHPACLPIAEIDALFSNPVPICTELSTPAGPIDNFMVTATGLPVIVECKLWRNPEGRREVVGQILDYAKELSRWSSSDLQREVKRRLRREGNPLLELVRAAHPDVDEADFNDALTANLRRGRFLLLIVGDGIREGVEAIAEYLLAHAGLHFSLGLVEMPIYTMPNGDRLVVPRVLARTVLITRNVVALPPGYGLEEPRPSQERAESDVEQDASGLERLEFWQDFVGQLKIDDPEQPPPRPGRAGWISLTLPVSSAWLTVFRIMKTGELGVFLSSGRHTPGAEIMQVIVEDWIEIAPELGGSAHVGKVADGRPTIIDSQRFDLLDRPDARAAAFSWLSERVNTFVNVLRPRIRAVAADQQLPEG